MLVEPPPQPDGQTHDGQTHDDPLHDRCRTVRDLLRAGEVSRALRALEALHLDGADPEPVAAGLSCLVECRLARGEVARASRAADQLLPLADVPGPGGALARHALGELAAALGDHEAAATHHLAAGALLGPGLDDGESVPWRSGAAFALTRLGRHREAATLAGAEVELAMSGRSPYAVANALRTAAATNSDGRRVLLLRQARAALEGVHADRLSAQIDTDLAVLLTLHGDPAGEALGLLRSAEEYAGREDLVPLRQRVCGLLERLGEEPRRIRSESPATLTATEQRTARMAADGLTNREIATRLGVTVKAVEWHLSHVYRKLGIRSRNSLSTSLGAPV